MALAVTGSARARCDGCRCPWHVRDSTVTSKVVRAEQRGERSEQCAAEYARGPSCASITRARGGGLPAGGPVPWLAEPVRAPPRFACRARAGAGGLLKNSSSLHGGHAVREESERLSHREKRYEADSVNCQSEVPSESLK